MVINCHRGKMSTDEILQENQKISLFLAHGKIFVWNPNDVCTLRECHRIVGTLVGCLPRLPRQNTHLGLPLQLMNEEASLLLRTGVCRLIDDTKPLMLPSPAQVTCFQELRRNQYLEQIEMYREERREEMRKHLPKIIEGRKAKKRKFKESQLESSKASGSAKDGTTKDRNMKDGKDEIPFDVESVTIPPISVEHTMVELFTENPWKEGTTQEAVEWRFPSSEQEVMRCRVFRDLWERGYFLTSGCKFGGDFLVYPGDPARYHAFFIAICIPLHQKVAAVDVVAMGRLGSNVKKTVLICSLDTEKDCVVYTSLQWTGIG